MGKESELVINAHGDTRAVAPQGYSSLKFTDRKLVTSSEAELLEAIIEQSRIRKEQDPSQNEATVKIETNLPWIALVGSGDWHIGNQQTDYELWHKHMAMIMETNGVYMVTVGDERDNFVIPKYTAGLFEGVINPDQQAEFVRIWLKRLDDEGKILARAGGNHDHFTWLQSGIDLEGLWYRQMKSPLFKNGGFLHLELNGTKYDGFIHHGQSLFNSNFNPNHASRRAFEFMGPFDFSIMGHKHIAETAHSYRWTDQYQRDVVMIRSGTYKTDDQYARAKQLGRGHRGGTTILFCTAEKVMLPFLKIEDAVMVMKALNKQ